MNQALLLNNDLVFNDKLNAWQLTGFYQSQDIRIYIQSKHLSKDTIITAEILLDIEADIEDWLESHEPDEHNACWL